MKESGKMASAAERVLTITLSAMSSLDRKTVKVFHPSYVHAIVNNLFRWENGFKNGYGILTYASGARFEGSWARDRANGEGIMYYANSDKYEGEVS